MARGAASRADLGPAAGVSPACADRTTDAGSVWPWVALGCGLVVLFHHLGAYGLWDPDEGRHAEIAREMFASAGVRRWAVLTFNGTPYHDKPVLYYWLTSLAYALGGVDAFSARVVSACAGAGVLASTLWWARRHWGPATAVASTLVLASTAEFVALGRYGDLNMLLTLWITAGVLAAHAWVERGGRGAGLVVAAVAAGLGTLTKGFVAPVLIAATLVGYLALRREVAALRLRPILGALAAYVAVTLPWFVAAGVIDPGYLRDFLLEHHVRRFVGGERHLHPKPLLFTPLMTLVAFLPWSVLLPGIACRAAAAKTRTPATDLCLCWVVAVVGFFTLSSGKLGTYVLPAMPPLALLMGRFLATLPSGTANSTECRWTNVASIVVAASFVVAGAALVWFARREWGGGMGSSTWAVVPVSTAIGATIGWLARRRRPRWTAGALAVGTMMAISVFYGIVAPRVSGVAGDAALARAIRAADPAGDVPVIAYRTQNASLLFHLARTVPRVDGPRKLVTALRGASTTFVVSRPEHVTALPAPLSHRLRLLYGNVDGGHTVYVYERPG